MSTAAVSESPRRVALLGAPNSGKTTIFNALTGARAKVGNYPGVTVERREGTIRKSARSVRVLDLPGSYSLRGETPRRASRRASARRRNRRQARRAPDRCRRDHAAAKPRDGRGRARSALGAPVRSRGHHDRRDARARRQDQFRQAQQNTRDPGLSRRRPPRRRDGSFVPCARSARAVVAPEAVPKNRSTRGAVRVGGRSVPGHRCDENRAGYTERQNRPVPLASVFGCARVRRGDDPCLPEHLHLGGSGDGRDRRFFQRARTAVPSGAPPRAFSPISGQTASSPGSARCSCFCRKSSSCSR